MGGFRSALTPGCTAGPGCACKNSASFDGLLLAGGGTPSASASEMAPNLSGYAVLPYPAPVLSASWLESLLTKSLSLLTCVGVSRSLNRITLRAAWVR